MGLRRREKKIKKDDLSHIFPPFRKKKGGKGIRPIIDFPFFGKWKNWASPLELGTNYPFPDPKLQFKEKSTRSSLKELKMEEIAVLTWGLELLQHHHELGPLLQALEEVDDLEITMLQV